MEHAVEEVARVFANHQRFVLTTHVNPDGDGLGSEIALAEWLASHRKQVNIINHSPTPAVYRFLDTDCSIAQYDSNTHADLVRNADVIVVMDTNHPGRLQSMESVVREHKGVKVCIDHHLEPAEFATCYLIDEQATSTGELVYRVLVHLSGKFLSQKIAQALYCAIMTDTGSFRYSHVDPEIHRIVAHLIECGACPGDVYREVYEQWTPGRIQLLAKTLDTMAMEYEGKLAHITVTREMLRKTGTVEADTDNFTTYPMSLSGVVAAILFMELSEGVKMSLRSRGNVPINELAKEFGGNGHMNAAGARSTGASMSVFKENVIHAADKYFTNEGKRKK
jgi:phosphoesterase RecJ-like protein